MAAGLNFAVKAITLLPRTGVIGGTRVLSKPIIWRALTKGAADGVAYGDATLTIDQQFEVIVDVNEARLASTAAVGGGIFLATQLWFYNKLKMAERLLEAGRIIEDIKDTSNLIKVAIETQNTEQVIIQGSRLEAFGEALVLVNDGLPVLDEALIKVADPLFDVSNLIGINAVADDVVRTGAEVVAEGVAALTVVDELLPKVQTLFTAAEASAEATKTATALSRFGSGAKVAVGKILLVDTVIWGITLGLDLGLNLFMSEDEQENLPIIGFLFEGAGWSPIGAGLEWVVVNTVELFVGEDTAETLYEAFVAMIILASQTPYIEDVFEIVLGFYVDEINGNLLVDLDFSLPELSLAKMAFNPFKGIVKGDPLIILEVAVYAIISKIVIMMWIVPAFKFTHQALTGGASQS